MKIKEFIVKINLLKFNKNEAIQDPSGQPRFKFN